MKTSHLTRALCAGGTIALAAGLALATEAPAMAATTTVNNASELEAAWSGGGGTQTIVLGADIVLNNAIGLSMDDNWNYTLDLNGHTLDVRPSSSRTPGIRVPVTSTLTIEGTGGGGLQAIGGGASDGAGGAGIGGTGGLNDGPDQRPGTSCGTVIVNGGAVSAIGIGASAGIGGGGGALGGGDPSGQAGDGCALTVNGGIVTATTGDARGAAIGAGGGDLGGSAGTLVLGGSGTPVQAGSGDPVFAAGRGTAPLPTATAVADRSFAMDAQDGDSENGTPATAVIAFSSTITYDDGFGGTTTTSVIDGGSLELPTAPTRDGYTFAGWHYDSTTGAAFDPERFIDAPFTLFASWTANAVTPVDPSTPTAPTASTSKTLASTGFNGGWMIGGAAALLVAGAGALIWTRKRRA